MRIGRTVALVLLLAGCGRGEAPPGRGTGSPGALPSCRPQGVLSVGMAIPSSCRFRAADGSIFALASLRGRPAYINFWASWCVQCREEMPALERFHQALGDRLAFVGVDLLGIEGETEASAREFARSTGISYPWIFDRGGLLFAHFSPKLFMPASVLVDADGIVRYRSFGPRSFEELKQAVARDLGIPA